MRKKYYLKLGLLLTILLFPTIVKAGILCNDGSTSSCNDCHQGCCSHHGGCTSGAPSIGNGSNNSTNNNYSYQKQVTKEIVKSNDTSLKEVSIDGEIITMSDIMSYTTNKDSVHLYALANNINASIEYNRDIILDIGENKIFIKVIAENGEIKEYVINITREKELSNNKNIKIIIDGEEVGFNNFKSESIYIFNSETKVDIKYELEDPNAKAEIIGNNNLKVGKNEVTVKVTAENGEEQNYTIVLDRYGKFEEIFLSVIVIGLCGAISFGVYKFYRKIRESKI